MPPFKWINLGLFIFSIGASFLAYGYWASACMGRICGLSLIDLTLAPLIWGGLGLSIILFFLLLFPARVFKYWLLAICSWGLPVSIFFIVTANPNTAFPIGPGTMAWLMSYALGAVTILFTILFFSIEYYRKRRRPQCKES